MSRQLAEGTGRLAGRRCVITGSTGMAGAAARRFRAEGADVFVISVDAFAAARAKLGRLDGVFAVAGGSGRRAGDGPLHDVPLAGWDATMALNATTTFLAMREALRWMIDQPADEDKQRGSIVLMSS